LKESLPFSKEGLSESLRKNKKVIELFEKVSFEKKLSESLEKIKRTSNFLKKFLFKRNFQKV